MHTHGCIDLFYWLLNVNKCYRSMDHLVYLFLLVYYFSVSDAYRNPLYTIAKDDESRTSEYKCVVYESVTDSKLGMRNKYGNEKGKRPFIQTPPNLQKDNTTEIPDPFEEFQNKLHKFLYGETIEIDDEKEKSNVVLKYTITSDYLRNYVVGNYMRAELFNNKSAVHLQPEELLHRGYCKLNITRDFMQTAVNAFAIFLYGSLDDIERLPADYVLRSTRTISMMKIAREKLAATWRVIKVGKPTNTVSYETLEMYRPLFKYITGREIARLNLSDERILNYIGTHPDLNRHQMGVVANKYIELNKHWSEPKYLNLMNNLLCGVPMTFMRKIPENIYLQLSHQIFYHIRACDPLQRRFYYAMMTRTQALGKPFSWNARDVSRLGLLLAEVNGPDLSAINPEAIAGITAHVMMAIPPQNLKYLSDLQLKYMGQKVLNILARKLKTYNDQLQSSNNEMKKITNFLLLMVILITLSK